MTASEEWTLERLKEMVANGAEENVHLDFKSGTVLTLPINDEKRKDICKDVSAFANSDGGVLIYGITEVDHKADSFSFVDGNAFTKERLEQIINDGIQRRIDGIVITPLRADNDIKKTVYVVEVPISQLAPHMTKDNKYYKRFNFMSVAMEEYEVRQTFNRKQNVKLDVGEVRVALSKTDSDMWERNCLTYRIFINLQNTGRVPAKDYRIKVYTAPGLAMVSYDNTEIVGTSDILGESLSTLKTPTLFPGEELSVMSFEVGLSFEVELESVPLHCFIYTETGYTQKVLEIADQINKWQIVGKENNQSKPTRWGD